MSKIEFEDVSFSYNMRGKNNILNHMTTSFESEKITVLTGPSGCGKSTLLYIAAGIYPQYTGFLQNGQILVDGQKVGNLSPDKRCALLGMMFQNPDLQFCMDTVVNEILFCLGNIQTQREEMEDIMDSALEFCGIFHLKNRMLQSLSGGEKQKAMLACLIALNPKWLLLDEPFANVDERSAKELVQKIKKLHSKGMGILVVDHRLDYWTPIANEIRLMDRESGISLENYKPDKLSNEILITKTKSNEPTESILQLKNLTVSRGNKSVLSEINIEFQRNKIYGILGDSGSGKSTLFGAIIGFYKYQGDILLNGKNLRKVAQSKAGIIGFVTQSPQDQFVADTVLDEIRLGLKNRSGQYDIEKQAESILRDIDLWRYRNFSPYMLSQGQQRRLGVAALLAYDCQVLICDEPTYAQDRDNTISIMNALVKKTVELGMTLIISTHDQKLAKDYSDILLQLKEGKLYEISKSSL